MTREQDQDQKTLGRIEPASSAIGAPRDVTPVVNLLNRFEEFDVECIGWNENGHRVWEIKRNE